MTTSTKEIDFSDEDAVGTTVVKDPETGLPIKSDEEKDFTVQGEECTGSCIERPPGQ